MTWEDAVSYCSSLSLGGLSGWRLPTLDEIRGAGYFYPVTDTDKNGLSQTYDVLAMKGGISTMENTRIWTSTPTGDQQYWSMYMGPPDVFGIVFKGQWKAAVDTSRSEAHERVSKVTDRNAVLCVRPIDTDLLQIARDAQASHPVADVASLKNYIPLNKARLAFQAGQYQESIAQAQNAIALKADPETAYYGIGISYGMLGEWDQAISSLNSALKVGKQYGDGETEAKWDDAVAALKWAKDSQKAAKSGKAVKDRQPVWK
jgi:hypothetical protein